ncbi:MAG: squalene/phytoene synthase family protein [Xanthomonadaceae bacterium]|nr:squalene/phytoene synthase family protein [Xanthomonadaceae bacterium]
MTDATSAFASFERKWLAADPENTVVAVFLPAAQRAPASAFGCLIHELSAAAFHVRETQVAATKLAWWRRELADAAFGNPGHPVTQALFACAAARETDPALWPALADGAIAQLDTPGAGTLAAAIEQLDPFFGAVARAESALLCAGAGNPEADAALWTLSHLLRELPRLGGDEAHLPLPLGLLARHELTRAELVYESPRRNMLVKDFLDELVLEGNGAFGVRAVRALPLRVRAALDRRRIAAALRVTDPLEYLRRHPHAGRWRTLSTAWREAREAAKSMAGLR